jgi:hypothetical protein
LIILVKLGVFLDFYYGANAQKIMGKTPDFFLFVQHGWADTNRTISQFARALVPSDYQIVAPNLGYFKTWLRIEPLIEQVEQTVLEKLTDYPATPLRLIGHSLGGLIWLEVLHRNPQWWPQIHSLVLLGSPVGGSHVARMIDPFGIGLGIARDLGINRRAIAEEIARCIPTLMIAGDLEHGTDGLVTVENTKFSHAKFICLPGFYHPDLRNHPILAGIIQDFWNNPLGTLSPSPDLTTVLIQRLRSMPGMTDTHRRDFYKSKVYLTLKNGFRIRIWKNPLQVTHVFLDNGEGKCLYSSYVGWLHTQDLYHSIDLISTAIAIRI